MKSWPVAALFALGLSVCAAVPALAGDDQDSTWITDYARAKAAARATGKPIFLVFRCER
jgi:hypothetical protein